MTFVPVNARTLTTSATRLDSETETFVASSFGPTQVTSATNRSSGDPRESVDRLHTAPYAEAWPFSEAPPCALRSVGADASEDGTGRGTPITVNARQDPLTYGDSCGPLDTDGSTYAVKQGWRVRRLTPVECERLQGFPDGYTDVPGASDSARYAALGNSMAVPVLKWIGQRIEMVTRILEAA